MVSAHTCAFSSTSLRLGLQGGDEGEKLRPHLRILLHVNHVEVRRQEDLPTRRHHRAPQQPEQGRLATILGAEYRDQPPLLELHAYALQRRPLHSRGRRYKRRAPRTATAAAPTITTTTTTT
eukprot:627651-Prymnesium_polylepis.1